MVTFNRIIEYPKDSPETRIVVVGDQHYGASDADLKRYNAFLKENLAPPNSWLISVGDGLDAITSRDPRFEIGGIAKPILQAENNDDILDLQIEMFVNDHMPYRDQILGLGLGNHENAVRVRGMGNAHRRICTALNVKNIGYSCIMELRLREAGATHRGMNRSFKILTHHGFGGSNATEGGALSTFCTHSKNFVVDAAFYGHKHDHCYKRTTRVGIDQGGNQDHQDVIVALVGTYLKTFNDKADPSWAETKGFPPRFLRGGWILKLTPENNGGWLTTRMSEG